MGWHPNTQEQHVVLQHRQTGYTPRAQGLLSGGWGEKRPSRKDTEVKKNPLVPRTFIGTMTETKCQRGKVCKNLSGLKVHQATTEFDLDDGGSQPERTPVRWALRVQLRTFNRTQETGKTVTIIRRQNVGNFSWRSNTPCQEICTRSYNHYQQLPKNVIERSRLRGGGKGEASPVYPIDSSKELK